MHLNCTVCGRELGAGELLADQPRCATCQTGPAPEDVLAAARAEWKQRLNVHEQALGLGDAQRAQLVQALVGSRSLWDCSAPELRALAARLESLRTPAQVQAFLAVHPADADQDGPSLPDDKAW